MDEKNILKDDKNIDSALHDYARSAVTGKAQDLQKFYEKNTQPHHSTAPMKRWLVITVLCLFVVSMGVAFALSMQTPGPLSDVEVTEFAYFHAGKYNVPEDRTDIFANCVAKSEVTAQKYAMARLPKIACSDISAYWFHRMDNKNDSVGISGKLTPADSTIQQITAYWFRTNKKGNTEFISEFGFEKLPNTTQWQDFSISYSDPIQTEEGNVYKVYFIDSHFHYCLDIYAPANSVITDLLTEIF